MTYTPDYAEEFHERVEKAREIANEAKSKRGDPEPNVEIPVAEDMAERCEKLLEREYGSKIHGLAKLIRDLEEGDEVDGREEMSLALAEDFATGDLSGDFDNDAERVEAAIRTCVAILTEGVVAAPIEGIGKVEIQDNDDGTQFIRVPYFGPIRSAGGTAQAVSVLVADYVRDLLDIAIFKPREEEVERYVEEIHLYDGQVGMQYCPPKDKARYIVRHVPIMVDGQPNLQAVGREVDGYRDLERIEGNAPRDGMCLVMAEGIGLKAPKLQRYSNAFGLDSWDWLEKLISGGDDEDEEDDADGEEAEQEADNEDQDETAENGYEVPLRTDEVEVLDPAKKFMADALAGRPIFAGPSQEGGFRLRYGRSRNAGHAAVGLNPASMILTSEFIAPSTQLKTERPGKAAGAVPADSIEGPTVRLDTGELIRVDSEQHARDVQDHVEEIVDLGEIAIPFGEFIENNHPLAPATYAPGWWERELEKHDGNPENINHDEITVQQAIQLTQDTGVPLHPEYTYLWHDINPQEYAALRAALNEAEEIQPSETEDANITPDEDTEHVKLSRDIADVLEPLLVPHILKADHIQIKKPIYQLLELCVADNPIDDDVLGQVNDTAPFTVRPRSLTRIGARMGRPEKAEKREMKPMVHALYPIRDAGTDERRIDKAAQHQENADHQIDGKSNGDEYKGKGVVEAEINYRVCPNCDNETFKSRCPECQTRTEEKTICKGCGQINEEAEHGDDCKRCGANYSLATKRELNVNQEYLDALDNINERENSIGKTKGVKRLTSDSKIPEPLEKGLLRSKYNISTFRDGTARYDMCDLPLTSFKPQEIGITVEQAKQLGYTEDIHGEPLEKPDQLCEIKMQDVIVAHEAGEYMLDVANYIDDLLEKYYDMEPFYNAETKEDLVGEMLLGMAPHTSAATAGRLLGFTDASANYAHPFFHAAKRRNCFHPSTKLTVKLNGEWQRIRIDELVETYLEPDTQGYDDSYDDGTIVQEIANHPVIEELKVPSMTDQGHRTIENVTHLSKHKAPEHMVTIKTEDGDELQVTPDHKISVKNDNGDELMTRKKASQIEEGDELFDYNEDKIEEVKDYTEIDMLEHLLRDPDEHDVDIENVMIRGMQKDQVYELLTEEIKPQWDDGRFYKMQSSCEYLGIKKKSLDNYLRRQSIPATLFLNLYNGDVDKVLDKIPKDVELGMNSDNVNVPRTQTIDEELACLIGYYTAEGFTRQKKDDRVDGAHNGSNHTDIANIDSEARDFIKRVFENKFNKQNLYTANEKRITASGNLTRFFFNYVLDSGRLAHDKSVPDIIRASSEDIIASYLSGYISGDGSYSGKGTQLEMGTVSEELKDDISEILRNVFNYDYNTYVEDPVSLHEKFPEYYDEDTNKMSKPSYNICIKKDDSVRHVQEYGIHLSRKENNLERNREVSKVSRVKYNKNDTEHIYNLTVSKTHKLAVLDSLTVDQCDGDEDSVMLLMDGLVNFSRKYLPSQRGKNMMDAPIVMSVVMDPEEIDDEAHNVDIVEEYPLEFFESTMYAADPDDAPIEIAEDRLDEPVGFKHSIGASDINAGPLNTAYKSVDGMDDATKKQMDLADKTRGVDEKEVASMVVEKHFFPDIIGNLTAFARQEFQCANNHMHRRAPASGRCQERDWCDAEVRLTVYEGMVDKYVEAAKELSEDYELDLYTRQRLEALDDRIEALFKDDKSEQTSIDDFLG